LQKLRSNIIKAFPNARFGTNKDDYAFKRVRPTITAFKKAVTEKTAEVKVCRMIILIHHPLINRVDRIGA